MSTTMPSSSRSGRRKVASTTKVAPCSRCAGPNTSPCRLWATIMWSRTVTENTSGPPVGEDVTQGAELPGRELRHHVGQLLEPGGPGEEYVESRVAQQLEGERHPLGRRTPIAAGRGHRADLTRTDRESVGVEPSSQRELHLGVAVPAQVHHRALPHDQVERALEP